MKDSHWQVIPHDADLIERIGKSANVSPVIAQILAARGILDPDLTREFLDAPMSGLHDPDLLPDVQNAAEIVHEAAKSGKKITIFGDYDCDGMSGTAILYSGLKMLGANVNYTIPNRLEDGYGLNFDAIDLLAQRGTDLVVTVDCGVANLEEIEHARKQGLKVVVTDHHQAKDQLPPADAVVHPAIQGSQYPFAGICGAGVAFKLMWAILRIESGSRKVGDQHREFLLQALSLATIGTVADVVPLLDENRVIVRHGLKSLLKSKRAGVRALLRVAKADEKPQLDADDIGFAIGPRLNAAGRLGQAQLGVELLTTDCHDRAASLAEYIDGLNASRDTIERSVYLAATRQIRESFDQENDPAFVLDGTGWHAGVIGIVAGRIADRFHRPTVIITWDKLGMKPGMGSARSAGSIRLNEAFAACEEHLISHGGHAAAAGLKISKENLARFREDFVEYCSTEQTHEDMVKTIRIDAEVLLHQIDLHMMNQLDQMAPFGQGNPRPRFCASLLQIVGEPKTMGGGDRHLNFQVAQNGKTMRVIAFGKGEIRDELATVGGEIDLVFEPVVNEFRGYRKVELRMIDWRPSHQCAPT